MKLNICFTGVGEGGGHRLDNRQVFAVERRNALREHLDVLGIGTAIYYPVPLHMQVCFSDLGYSEGAFPVTERLCKEVLSVPVFPELGEERRSLVVEAVGEFFG